MSDVTDDGQLRAWAQRMRAHGSLADGLSDDDVVAIVMSVLDRARRDHAAYVDMTNARSDVTRTLTRYEKLIAAALPAASGAGALARRRRLFAIAIGNGSELDAALSLVAGREVYAARDFASPGGRGWTLVELHREVSDALQLVSVGRGGRRGEKYVSVFYLAHAFVRMTGEVPAAATAVERKGSATTKGPGDLAGDFAALVEAADVLSPIAGGDGDFARAVRDVLADHHEALQSAVEDADLFDPVDHPAFGPATMGKAASEKTSTKSMVS